MNNTLEILINNTRKRSNGFKLILEHLKFSNYPIICETGCMRPPSSKWIDELGLELAEEVSIKVEGASTIIFDQFVNLYSGEFHSVDINQKNIDYAKTKISDKTNFYCSDSVKFLWDFSKTLEEKNQYVDLLYLDSFDFKKPYELESSIHHLKELTAILGRLKENHSLVVVDDNFLEGDIYRGKGSIIYDFMASIGKPLIHNEYHLIWKF